jgi:hypothetical protein
VLNSKMPTLATQARCDTSALDSCCSYPTTWVVGSGSTCSTHERASSSVLATPRYFDALVTTTLAGLLRKARGFVFIWGSHLTSGGSA